VSDVSVQQHFALVLGNCGFETGEQKTWLEGEIIVDVGRRVDFPLKQKLAVSAS
jgi:hypothetical protein